MLGRIASIGKPN